MKKKLKIKRKVGLAILGLLTVFASCEKEDTHHHKHEKANIVRNVKLSDLTSLQNVLKKNSAQRRDTINYFDLIDENSITVITQNNGDRTYTFSLQLVEINKLTNLVVRESGNEHSFDLVEYSSVDLERWKTDIESNYIPSAEVTVTVTPLSSNVAICLVGSYVCPSGLHSTGEEIECVFGFGEWSYTLMQVPCSLDGGDEAGGDSGSSNGNTPPASEEPDPYTEPVFPVLTSAILDFIATLYPDWDNLAVETQTQIVNYLIQNTKNNIINPQAQ